MRISLSAALIATLAIAVVMFLLRAFPFLVFSKKDPPPFVLFIERYIPSMIIAILIIYCLKDIQLTAAPFGLPSIIALTCTVALHLWRNNSMISIFGGTIIYMVLNYVLK
ncbi:MAG: AzlD domain-containing protein [Treponema sp.]|nr:AzlD domain-containing protein [Treponema sp.]